MSDLEVRLLGDFEVLRDGKPVALPASRKTRALLAFLVVTGRPQRRDRLCEMFWDIPDDPRGALRWSLSKLRGVVNDEDTECLTADRERVMLNKALFSTDVQDIERRFAKPDVSARSLAKGLAMLRDRPYLVGLDQPDSAAFTVWLASEHERIRGFRAKAAYKLIEHKDTPPDLALSYARQWIDEAPYSTHAADAVVRTLRRAGEDRQAETEASRLKAHFKAAEMDWTPEAPSPRLLTATTRDRDQTLLAEQKIQFCKTPDNVTIAYASVGKGPPIVKAANWLSHLELDWKAPIWTPLFRALAADHTFIRYDERGNGLSDWDVPDLSQSTFVTDLETVVDTLKLDKFPLLGISQGAAVSIEYATRHPDRVTKLILFGGYPKGWRVDATPERIREREAMMTLTESGWGQDNPAYRHIFSATFMPDATPEQLAWFDEFQRQTTSPKNAARFLSAFGDLDVSHLLSNVTVPTLVLHSRGDQRIPWETGRELAAEIPDARLVSLESRNHLLLEGEPAATDFVEAISRFLAE